MFTRLKIENLMTNNYLRNPSFEKFCIVQVCPIYFVNLMVREIERECPSITKKANNKLNDNSSNKKPEN